jgi:hypothetical protein
MDFSLVQRPLARASNKEYHFGLNCLDVKDRVFIWGIFMTPNVYIRRLYVVPPSIAVITAFAVGIPSKPQSIPNWLLRHSYIDGLFIDAHNVKLRLG